MGSKEVWKRLSEQTDVTALPRQSVVEIGGDRRVLIEEHFGVQEYSRDTITVKVRYGCVTVCGGDLELTRMTREQVEIGRASCRERV